MAKRRKDPPQEPILGLPQELILDILEMCPECVLSLSAVNQTLRNTLVPLLTEHFSRLYQIPQVPEGWTLLFVVDGKNEEQQRNGEEDKPDKKRHPRYIGFTPREWPPITKEGKYPYGAVNKLKRRKDSFDDNSQDSVVCIIPKESRTTQTQYDCRHSEVLLAGGRYSSSYPNAHPYTVTDATFLNEVMPNIDSIRCLFFISQEPAPNIVQLDMTHCLNQSYVLANQHLSHGVYECGKSYGDFSRQDRGTKYLRTLCPNLKYLKLSYPHVSWEDKSSPRNIDELLEFHNVKDLSAPCSLPGLQVLAVEYCQLSEHGPKSVLFVWKKGSSH